MNIPRLLGYRRENGRVGIRNHVIILPVDDLSNAACLAVENNIKGTVASPNNLIEVYTGSGRLNHPRVIDKTMPTMVAITIGLANTPRI